MKIGHFTVLLLLFGSNLNITAGDAGKYLQKYKHSDTADDATETKIVAEYSIAELVAELDPFYSDTLQTVRQKAYHLAYKKGLKDLPANRNIAVERLVKGINDTSGGLSGQILQYLQKFSPADFTSISRSLILAGLSNIRMPHYEKLVLLAGYINIGRDELLIHFRDPELLVKDKWYIAAALARMDQKEGIDYCLTKAKKLPINDNVINYMLPDLIYTRQKQALDFCIQLVYSDEKLCFSPNPDYSENILCAYRIIEKLAPVIVDFPIQVNPFIGLESSDYPRTLQMVRDWFTANTEYKILKDNF